jgi:hypothetical protein
VMNTRYSIFFLRNATKYLDIFSIVPDEETRRVYEKWNPDKLIKYREYLPSICLRKEIPISDSGECRRAKIYSIEISPSLDLMIEAHSSDEDDDDYCDLYFELLSESESTVDLF